MLHTSSTTLTMQSIIQSRYDRLEKALTALLDTIISYNPSVHAADELVDADDSVNEALNQRTYTYHVRKKCQSQSQS